MCVGVYKLNYIDACTPAMHAFTHTSIVVHRHDLRMRRTRATLAEDIKMDMTVTETFPENCVRVTMTAVSDHRMTRITHHLINTGQSNHVTDTKDNPQETSLTRVSTYWHCHGNNACCQGNVDARTQWIRPLQYVKIGILH